MNNPVPAPEILYEDNHLIVAIKPAGVLSQSDGSDRPDMLTILKKYIAEKYNKPGEVFLGLVHRLDMPTAGIMVFARTSKAASRLSEDIRNHRVNKQYYALTRGGPPTDSGVFRDNLSKDGETNISRVDHWGKLSELAYNIIGRTEDNLVLWQINLITGRSHQIRVQLSHRGYPILGDEKYAPDGLRSGHRAYSQGNLCLYAGILEFRHPVGDRKIMRFEKKPDFVTLFAD